MVANVPFVEGVLIATDRPLHGVFVRGFAKRRQNSMSKLKSETNFFIPRSTFEKCKQKQTLHPADVMLLEVDLAPTGQTHWQEKSNDAWF